MCAYCSAPPHHHLDRSSITTNRSHLSTPNSVSCNLKSRSAS
jgi:hypothetical protein